MPPVAVADPWTAIVPLLVSIAEAKVWPCTCWSTMFAAVIWANADRPPRPMHRSKCR